MPFSGAIMAVEAIGAEVVEEEELGEGAGEEAERRKG